jgi:uncharacterized protein YukE
MAQIAANPDKLKQLAKQFRAASDKVEQLGRELKRGLERADWHDAERQKFEERLNQSLRSLQHVAEVFEKTDAPELERKAQHLDQYRG